MSKISEIHRLLRESVKNLRNQKCIDFGGKMLRISYT